MCSMSAVSDYYMHTYPGRLNPLPGTLAPQPQIVVAQFDSDVKDMLRQALKLLDKIDKRLGDIECMDEAKTAFLATLGMTPDDIGA